MEDLLNLLKNIKPQVNFEGNKHLIDNEELDSFDIVTLVSEFDKAFNISIDGADITPENFNTLDNMVNLVKKNGAK